MQNGQPESNNPDEELEVIDRPDVEQDGATPIGRRTVLTVFLAAGLLTQLGGTGTAQAGAESWYPIPEESGSIPWW